MNKKFQVAIDGPSGAGKSTIAREIARQTGAVYLDTGAMYRAAGLWMLKKGVNIADEAQVRANVSGPRIDVRYEAGQQRLYLDGEDVSEQIRTSEISSAASKVSQVPELRARLVEMQREIAGGRSVVMDGRDIGTKVLPDATIKLFLVASLEERARRRALELKEKGLPSDFDTVYDDMAKRDYDDSTRTASPLMRAKDAVELDSTALTLDETVQKALMLLKEKIGEA